MITLPFAVLDRAGFGWGRYATKQEAEARAAELRSISGGLFDVVRVVTP